VCGGGRKGREEMRPGAREGGESAFSSFFVLFFFPLTITATTTTTTAAATTTTTTTKLTISYLTLGKNVSSVYLVVRRAFDCFSSRVGGEKE
jgi:hypothetical protein